MQKATGGYVSTCNASIALKDWINDFDIYKGAKYTEDGPIVTYTEGGIKKKRKQYLKGEKKIVQGVGKDIVFDLLEMKISKKIKDVLKIRQEAAKSSTAKLKAMIEGASSDSSIRG